ncbi:MAG TPA: SRPBCC family protein [Frankiaceae bacterium]|nr:SRPBCC family protein [Frankiaceae bacterium]
MGTVSHYVEVDVPAEQAYAWWRGLTNLPTIMPDVESVEPVSGGTALTHWKVHGPLGKTVEWDARIIEDVPNSKIAWTSVPGEDNDVTTSGAVRFDDHGGTTGVEVSLEYDPPAGAVGEAVAKMFADPQDKVERALAAFKQTIEQGASTGA